MKIPLVAVLALSLAGNFIGAYFLLRPAIAPAPTAGGAAPEPGAAAPSAPLSPLDRAREDIDSRAWANLAPGADLPGFVARLRAAGFPPRVVRTLVQQLVNERIPADPAEKEARPYWVAEDLAAAHERRQKSHRERQALLESLLGPEARPGATLDATTRERRFGHLSGDKVDALLKLERDYGEVESLLVADRPARALTPEESKRFQQERALVEREKLADLARILTPAELEQYELRNSGVARNLSRQLRGVELSEQEYAALYRLQKTFETQYPQGLSLGPDAYHQRMTAQLNLQQQFRGVLDEARFIAYLNATDYGYTQAREFTRTYPALTPAATYDFYRLQLQMQGAFRDVSQNQALSGAQRAERVRTIASEYEPRLAAVLGPEALAAYKQSQQGRVLNVPAGPARP